MLSFLKDVLYAFRQFRKEPRFTLLVALTFSIGIGMNAGVFSIMDALLLRPLSIPKLSRVVAVMERTGGNNSGQVALGNFTDWKERSHAFQDIAARAESGMTFTEGTTPERIVGSKTTVNLFPLLGVQPSIGRTFLPDDGQQGHDDVVILSYPFWQSHFGADASVLGRKIQLDERSYTVIGVMAQGFRYGATSDLWMPLVPSPAQLRDRREHNLQVLGRLRNGTTIQEAQAELDTIAAHLARAFPATNEGRGVRLQKLSDFINGDMTASYLKLMMGVVLLVQLIICANVANLLFSRSLRRQSELAIRFALGARRLRILRQLLVENVLLSLLGVIGGIAIARAYLYFSLLSMPQRVERFLPGWTKIGLNGTVLTYSILLAVVAGVVAGLAPSLLAMRIQVVDHLKAGSRTVSGSESSHRLRSILVTAQIALSVALVTGALLMTTGMFAMLHVTNRFSPKSLLTASFTLPQNRYQSASRQTDFYSATLARLRSLPEVSSAEIATSLPYNNFGVWTQQVSFANVQATPGEYRTAERIGITPGYLSSMQVPLLAGRFLLDSDSAQSLPVALVSRKFAERYFPSQNPIGQKIRLGRENQTPWITIAGVVEDVVTLWVEQTPSPVVYLSTNQFPVMEGFFTVRTRSDNPLLLAPSLRKAIAAQDSSVPLDNIETYSQYLYESMIGLWFVVAIFGINALIALFLAAVGIFGVMANTVSERTHEIGIRIALGARREDIVGMLLRNSVRLTAAGLACGIVLALGLSSLIANLVYGTSIHNSWIYLATAAIILAASLFAGYVPARAAAKVEPMQALRAD